MSDINTVSVIGMGYIGLPTCAMFASKGMDVIGIDVNPAVVEKVNRGEIHIVEPDLDGLIHKVVANGNLRAFTTPQPADAFIIAVPTPFVGDHKPDVSYVMAAARSIAPVLKRGDVVVLESTSPVGTTRQMTEELARVRPDLTFPLEAGEDADVMVAYSPERVLPGKVLSELINNHRSIGGLSKASSERAVALYSKIIVGDLYITTAESAELVKLTENAFRDVNIAFANELSVICDKLRINVWELIKLANMHPRVNILRPGPGVGGHCIAVDPWFIVAADPERSRLIRTAREVNNDKPHFVVDKVKAHAAKLKQPVIACLGLSYKADVDDLRESPAVEIVEHLAREKVGELLVVEPHVNSLPKNLTDLGLKLWDFDQATERANILLLLVDHASFLTVDHDVVKDKIVVDTRGAW